MSSVFNKYNNNNNNNMNGEQRTPKHSNKVIVLSVDKYSGAN